MTVKELLEKIRLLVENNPKILDATVVSEGCDCDGYAHDITYSPEEVISGIPYKATLTINR